MISFIFAMDKQNTIGKDNQLPWHLPADLAFFKKVTSGHSVIMGRKTFESIGRPLPGRENIVLTSNKDVTFPGCKMVYDFEQLVTKLKASSEEVFVIGGAEVYRQLLPFADKMYITLIHHSFEGDSYFPDFDQKEWTILSQEKGIKNEKNPYDYEFLIMERVRRSL
jgi:dihydrofolate reductase